jgi:RNA polymerase sigma-70 factor (ECF subfamily)
VRKTTACSDSELYQLAQRGDRSAFGELVDRHKDGLVSYLTRLTGSKSQAEDLAQEAFLRLYEKGHHYAEQGRLQSYLYRIATNLLRSELRRNQRWLRLRSIFSDSNGHRSEPVQQAEVLHGELSQQLTRALASLPLHYRAPIVLSYLEDRSHQEIADLLGIEEGTVKSRLHRGRALLRSELEPYRAGEPT